MSLFGIINDTQRTGFQVLLPKSDISKLDPVQTLLDYIDRTDDKRAPNGPAFLVLTSPYNALEASTVAKILEEFIALAGLAGKVFSAKSFRPTWATAAIDLNLNPDVVRRWKNAEVFFAHYVHSKTPSPFTDDILTHE